MKCARTTCSVGDMYCSAGTIHDPFCSNEALTHCAIQNFNNARGFKCDGPEDRNLGQTCGFVDSPSCGAACVPPNRTVCHVGADCAAGKGCTGTLVDVYLSCQ